VRRVRRYSGATLQQTRTVGYDALGKVSSKTEITGSTTGDYDYSTAATCTGISDAVLPGAHAVRRITAGANTRHFCYDANGNQRSSWNFTRDRARTVTYTPYNKPKTITTQPPVFRQTVPPSPQELETLIARIAERIGRALEREGLLARDCENSFLTFDPAAGGPMDDLLGHSITYRVAVGPRTGHKAFTLHTVPVQSPEKPRQGVAQWAGFSLHAGIGIDPEQREKLERLTRYVSRPPVSVERLALTAQGDVRYRLKTPYRDGTTHIVLEPLDFLARLAALVPPPRVHLTRYHGVFAPHAALRAAITPAGRGRGGRGSSAGGEGAPLARPVAMSWARRLKRVFAIEIEQCRRCGGRLTVIASIEEPALIERILAHLTQRACEEQKDSPFASRAPPQPSLF
jgi:hypothetical protein